MKINSGISHKNLGEKPPVVLPNGAKMCFFCVTYGCDEVRICIRQHANFERFQYIRHSTNVLKTFVLSANSSKSPCSKTDFISYKANSFSSNNEQVILW